MLGLMRQQSTVYWIAILLSLVLSAWASLRSAVINPDAICYVQSAEAMRQGLQFAGQLCGQAKWPFYSLLIFVTSSFTKLSTISAAYLIDALFSAILVAAFLRVVDFLKGNVWLAGIVILLAHELNAVREYIIRDHGFWAFYFVSVICLLHYMRDFRWRYALGWGASLVLATLFRIEGIFFLVGMPLIVSVCSSEHRLKTFFQLNAVILTLALIAISFYPSTSHLEVGHINRLVEVQNQLLHGIKLVADNMQAKAHIIARDIVSGYAAHAAGLIFALVLVIWYLILVMTNLSFIYSFLFLYALFYVRFTRATYVVLGGYIAINVAVTAIFLAENMFLSKRYLLALSLLLMIAVPFALERLYQGWRQRKWPLMLAGFLIVISGVGGIVNFGYSKAYLREAGEWLAEHVPHQAQLYSNNDQVAYYSHHFGFSLFEKMTEFAQPLTVSQLKQYDYVALSGHTDPALLKKLGRAAVVFQNKRGDQVAIYKFH